MKDLPAIFIIAFCLSCFCGIAFTELRRALRRRRRDRFAAAALTGLLADHLDHADECLPNESCEEAVARLAVMHADAVIARLEKR